MPKQSAGLLLYRESATNLEVLLVHPGGPFWAGKDDGSWSIPKGEFDETEDPRHAAVREFQEETGASVSGELLPLGHVKQRSGKVVYAWAMRGDYDPDRLTSNTFRMEWPPGSGQQREFPVVDRAGWFPLAVAGEKILEAQLPFLTQLAVVLGKPRPFVESVPKPRR